MRSPEPSVLRPTISQIKRRTLPVVIQVTHWHPQSGHEGVLQTKTP